MKFSTREDVSVPIEHVFRALCDVEGFERQAMRRGADVRRIDKMTAPGIGMNWKVGFRMRGRHRELDLELVRFMPPNELEFHARSAGIDSDFTVELIALSVNRTRMTIGLDIRPLNLSARLLVQSLKLAKSSLTRRFKTSVSNYGKGLEERFERAS